MSLLNAPTDYGEEMQEARMNITTSSGKMYSEEELSFEQRLEIDDFLEGYKNNPSNSNKYRIGLHAHINKILISQKQALLREVLKHVVRLDDTLAVPVEAIQALMEGK
jgi:hypothetical protein